MANVAKIDENTKPALTAVSSSDANDIVPLYADPVTHRLLVDLVSGGTTTVDAGTTTTLAAGLPATVVNSGTTTNAVFDFGIPVAKVTDTSVTSNAIATGSKVFSVTAGNGWAVGDWLMIASRADVANYMYGQITAYSGPSVTVNVIATGGSGTHTDWNVGLSGAIGLDGAPIVWLGEYDAGTTYHPLDAVFYTITGSSYICTANTLNHLPTDAAFWDLMAVKGADGAGSGTVTSVSVTTANGFAGTVATPTLTPAITISTSVTGVLKGNGTAISAATSGTDYSPGTSALGSGIVKSTTGTGALSIATANTDYLTPPSGSAMLKAGAGGALANATAGTDYSAGTASLTTGLLKSTNGTGALSIAVSGTDIKTVNSNSLLGSGNLTFSVINWLGAWDATPPYTIYNPNDAVSYAGSSYICILQTTAAGENPTNLTYWNPLAIQGTPGVSGISGSFTQPFTTTTSVTVNHNFNAYPVVQVIDNSLNVLIPTSIVHTDTNQTVVTLATSTTGNVICTIGGVPTGVTTKSADYTLLETDSMVLVTAACTIKLPVATGLQGKIYYIKDMATTGVVVTVDGNGATIDGQTTQLISAQYTTLTVFTDGTNWYII